MDLKLIRRGKFEAESHDSRRLKFLSVKRIAIFLQRVQFTLLHQSQNDLFRFSVMFFVLFCRWPGLSQLQLWLLSHRSHPHTRMLTPNNSTQQWIAQPNRAIKNRRSKQQPMDWFLPFSIFGHGIFFLRTTFRKPIKFFIHRTKASK